MRSRVEFSFHVWSVENLWRFKVFSVTASQSRKKLGQELKRWNLQGRECQEAHKSDNIKHLRSYQDLILFNPINLSRSLIKRRGRERERKKEWQSRQTRSPNLEASLIWTAPGSHNIRLSNHLKKTSSKRFMIIIVSISLRWIPTDYAICWDKTQRWRVSQSKWSRPFMLSNIFMDESITPSMSELQKFLPREGKNEGSVIKRGRDPNVKDSLAWPLKMSFELALTHPDAHHGQTNEADFFLPRTRGS